MVHKYNKRPMKLEHGFSIVELMVVLAIAAVVLSISVPSVQNWRQNYNIKSAVMDLYAAMQMARAGAIKAGKSWDMHFAQTPIPRYDIQDPDQVALVRDVKFTKQDRYRGAITYGRPDSGNPIDTPTLTFDGNGLVSSKMVFPAFVYLKGTNTTVYYRVGMLYKSSSAKIERWNGTNWK